MCDDCALHRVEARWWRQQIKEREAQVVTAKARMGEVLGAMSSRHAPIQDPVEGMDEYE